MSNTNFSCSEEINKANKDTVTELRCRYDDLNMSELSFTTHVSSLNVLVQ